MTNYVFVYGTLKSDEVNSNLMSSARLIGCGSTVDAFILKQEMFPSLYKKGRFSNIEPSIVTGELYEVPESLLNTLDHFEGHPDFYKREIILVRCNEKNYNAFIYFKQG